ncbi:hypothetical protein [Streptomyces sp. NBC_01233]|uniref:hypothetical protein n=1 Tax=Streptomyces sp. NBC_01233 TaxID=2903787 RepID=UPI002E131BEB|nr:hypothetical protein OG332_37705 [Streptomyces sp. NBC_01233]
MQTLEEQWERSLGQLQKLGQLSTAAHGRATAAREMLASIGANPEDHSGYLAAYSALQARSQACDMAYLRASTRLVHRAASGGRPPARLPRPWLVGPAGPSWWVEAIRRSGAVWRSIPEAGPELALGMPLDHPAVAAVTAGAEQLSASGRAKDVRGSSALYEITRPVGPDGRRAPAGVRIRPGKEEETRRLHTDRHKVWERARAYGDATQALLAEWRHTNT